jgi:hypothetical protein
VVGWENDLGGRKEEEKRNRVEEGERRNDRGGRKDKEKG